MGYLARLFGGSIPKKEGKGGALTTLPQAPIGTPTPDNPGAIVPFKSVPTPETPRYFMPMESQAIQQLEKEAKEAIKSTAQAYQAFEGLSKCDADVAKFHYQFKGKEAVEGLKQVGYQAQFQSQLMALKPEYDKIQSQLNFDNEKADRQIDLIKQDLETATALLTA